MDRQTCSVRPDEWMQLEMPFCDTDFRGYSEMSADDILSRCLEEGGECRFIVLTGGEPSLQVDEQLISTLHQAGYYLSMETNGTHAIPEGIDWVTCSPKVDFTEGGEPAVKQVDELKLIFDGEHQISDHGIACTFRYLQPCDVGNDSRNYLILNECIKYIKAHPEWQLSVQMHKIVGIR